MSTETFTLALTVGSALIALWIAIRAPWLGPQGWVGVAAALLGAGAVVSGGPWAIHLVGAPLGAFAAVFLVALPLCIYLFLVAAWVILHFGRLLRPPLR